jgi:ABC-type microcin C transport system permease subunit YejE
MEVRVLVGAVGGAFGSWINVNAIRHEEEEIVSAMPVAMVCVVRRPRPAPGLSL